MNIKKILAIVITLAICLALIAGCGKKGSSDGQTPDSGNQSSDSSTPSGESKKDEGKKEDGKKDEGKNDGKQSDTGKKDDKQDGKQEDGKQDGKSEDTTPSDAPTEIVIPSATPGNSDASYEVEPQSFSDTAGQVTKVGDNSITYKVMESKSGEDLEDYSLFDPADYKTTDKTAELEYSDRTPFYTRQEDKWYISAVSELKAGDTILIVVNDKSGDLEGVIIFSK